MTGSAETPTTQRAPDVPAPASARGARDLAYFVHAAAFAVMILAFLVERSRIGLRLPVPWPDEGSFLWPALAFRDTGGFFAPEVHPGREILWMPPGMMITDGLVFRVVPFSLNGARTVSAVFLCGAFAALGAMTKDLRGKLGHATLAAAFLHFCPIVAVVGNTARQEAFVLGISFAGFLLLDRRRTAGLGVLLLGPVFHPNGLFPLLSGGLLWLTLPRAARRTTRVDLAIVAISMVACALYAVYVGRHFDWFVTDMMNQLKFKAFVSLGEGGPVGRLREPAFFVPTFVLAAAAVEAYRLKVPAVRTLTVLSATFAVQTVTAAGWLYEVYPATAALLASIVGLETALVVIARKPSLARFERWSPIAVTALLLAMNATLVLRSPFINRSLDRATVTRPGLSPEYVTAADRAVVGGFLRSITPERELLAVQFVPDAEALLYERLRGPTLRFVQQTFYESHADIVISHESVWFPAWIRELQVLKMFYMHGVKPRETTIRERNGTERWVVYDWRVRGVGVGAAAAPRGTGAAGE